MKNINTSALLVAVLGVQTIGFGALSIAERNTSANLASMIERQTDAQVSLDGGIHELKERLDVIENRSPLIVESGTDITADLRMVLQEIVGDEITALSDSLVSSQPALDQNKEYASNHQGHEYESDPETSQHHYNLAAEMLDTAIANGVFSNEDGQSFESALSEVSRDHAIALLDKLGDAINSQKLQIDDPAALAF